MTLEFESEILIQVEMETQALVFLIQRKRDFIDSTFGLVFKLASTILIPYLLTNVVKGTVSCFLVLVYS